MFGVIQEDKHILEMSVVMKAIFKWNNDKD